MSYLITVDNSEFLKHYGVKGMKWGHHKYANRGMNQGLTVRNNDGSTTSWSAGEINRGAILSDSQRVSDAKEVARDWAPDGIRGVTTAVMKASAIEKSRKRIKANQAIHSVISRVFGRVS